MANVSCGAPRHTTLSVMAGPVPAIHEAAASKDVDARDKPGHDDAVRVARNTGTACIATDPPAPPFARLLPVIPGRRASVEPGISRFWKNRCPKPLGSGFVAIATPRNDGAKEERRSKRDDGASPYCVFATLGGAACVTNWLASSMAMPSGVGMRKRNGTRTRVPAIGAKVISMSRWAARYLITGRSGI